MGFLKKLFIFFFVGFLLVSATLTKEKSLSIVYLTWMHDPTTTMTVQWHSSDQAPSSQVLYRKMGEAEWRKKEGIYDALDRTNLLVHTVELDELEPDAMYQFKIAGKKETFLFRTLPKTLVRPVKFAVGGDAYFYLSVLRRMNEQIASCDPDFVVVGGDIAYTNGVRGAFKGKGWQIKRWRTFLKEWKKQMIASDGRMIPIVATLGNHDVKAIAPKPMSEHLLFYDLFAMPEKGVPFRTIDAGDYLSLFLLDTGHSYNIEGQQTSWLKRSLSERENVQYKMAAYHIAAYPSVYPYGGQTPNKIRLFWNPLFERYHLNVAFEHHNHAYKRTFPLKRGEIDPDGVVYMGDGSWGVTPRKPRKMWYLASAAQENAVCLVTLKPDNALVESLNIKGQVLDSLTTMPTKSMVAWNEGRLIQN